MYCVLWGSQFRVWPQKQCCPDSSGPVSLSAAPCIAVCPWPQHTGPVRGQRPAAQGWRPGLPRWRGPVEERLPCRLEAPGQALTAASFSGKFLADNIVGSVLVFSLMLWIPVSILVHCVVSCPLVRL